MGERNVYFDPKNRSYRLVKRRNVDAALLHSIGVSCKFTSFFDQMMRLDEENRCKTEQEENREVWKKWRCDPTQGKGLLHLYGDQAYLLYKLKFALEQLLDICPPAWDNPDRNWESIVNQPTLRL